MDQEKGLKSNSDTSQLPDFLGAIRIWHPSGHGRGTSKAIIAKKKTILVRRLPGIKVIRLQPFGLTTALFLMTLMFITLNPMPNAQPFQLITVFLLFALGSYWGTLFLILPIVLSILAVPQAAGTIYGMQSEFVACIMILSRWYLVGFLAGLAFSATYNLILLAYIKIGTINKRRFLGLPAIQGNADKLKISFAYDPGKSLNIIKSPIEEEEEALGMHLQTIRALVHRLTHKPTNAIEIQGILRRELAATHRAMSKPRQEHLTKLLKDILQAWDSESEDLAKVTDFEVVLKRFVDKTESGEVPEASLRLIQQQLDPVVEAYQNKRSEKLYNYSMPSPPPSPYTIAFVANPLLKNRSENRIFARISDHHVDPVAHDLELFLKGIDDALASLERNEVIGQHSLWSRIRVIAYFNKEVVNLKKPDNLRPLVDGFEGDFHEDGRLVQDVLVWQPEAAGDIKRMIVTAAQHDLAYSTEESEQFWREVDVVYVLSASEHFTRSSAVASDFPVPEGASGKADGDGYEIDFTKGDNFVPQELPQELVHEWYSTIPGIIALNVLTAREKTYVHEFVHAMASTVNGLVADEYADEFDATAKDPENDGPDNSGFYVNRLDRRHDPRTGRFTPVPKVFSKFNGTDYFADLEHPSEEENWRGVFPERPSFNEPCLMDRGWDPGRFDNLLRVFVHDRMWAKTGRRISKKKKPAAAKKPDKSRKTAKEENQP